MYVPITIFFIALSRLFFCCISWVYGNTVTVATAETSWEFVLSLTATFPPYTALLWSDSSSPTEPRHRRTQLQWGASPHQSLDGKSDDGWEEEKGRDQDVKERQGGEGLGGVGDGVFADLIGHKCLEGKKFFFFYYCRKLLQYDQKSRLYEKQSGRSLTTRTAAMGMAAFIKTEDKRKEKDSVVSPQSSFCEVPTSTNSFSQPLIGNVLDTYKCKQCYPEATNGGQIML